MRFSTDDDTYLPNTLFESENEWQKIEQGPIPLPRASRNFPDVKTRNEKNSIIGLQEADGQCPSAS